MAKILYVERPDIISNGLSVLLLNGLMDGYTVEVAGNIDSGQKMIQRGYDVILIGENTGEPGEAIRWAEQLVEGGHKVRLIADEETQSEKVVCLNATKVQTEPGYLSYDIWQILQSPKPLLSENIGETIAPGLITLPEAGLNLELVIEEIQRNLIEQALVRTRFVRTPAADLLGMSFRSLRHLIFKLKIDVRKLKEDHQTEIKKR